MKRLLILPMLLLLNAYASAQGYEVSRDPVNGSKVLKGIITRDMLESDTAFAWYHQNMDGYTPNAKALQLLKEQRDSIQLIVFSGTWCSDSHFIIPKLFMLLDAAEFPANRLTLIGVDRSKTTTSHLAEAFGIVGIPSIIVMKNGKETGRVVEYGNYGMFDMDLAEVLQSTKNK